MKKTIVLFLSGIIMLLLSNATLAQPNPGRLLEKQLDQAAVYLQSNKHIDKVWPIMQNVAELINNHPEYNDGIIAEGMNETITQLLQRPWKYAKPYLIGPKSSPAFQAFVLEQIDEYAPKEQLKVIRNNITDNCNPKQFTFCKKVIDKVNRSINR